MNVAKSKVLIFEKFIEPTLYDFYLYNGKLEIVTSFKYLGTCIYFKKKQQTNGNWHRTQK